MRIFLAGATGAIGRFLVPMLLEAGHSVTGTTRSAERADWLRSIGADAAVVDVFDAAALRVAVAAAGPEVVIHQLTDLARGFSPEDLARNSQLRKIGTKNLVDAAVAAGAQRLIAQSAGWIYAPGPSPRIEADPFRARIDPVDTLLDGVVELERLVLQTPEIEGLALRYGLLYGPGTAAATAADSDEPRVDVRAAAAAAALAVSRGSPGPYNVVDDGSVSNARARAELGWTPESGR
jgi:nucleoside-diphosphate-sugar epimerase